MLLGIIGFPQTGKTTIFNALTRGDVPAAISGGRFEVHTAVVDVPDARVDRLSLMFQPEKTIYAKVTYADIAGIEGGAKKGYSGALLTQLNQMDGLLHVVRTFEDPSVPHSLGSVNPLRDVAEMDAELLLNDLIAVERKLERLEEDMKKGGKERLTAETTRSLFLHLKAALEESRPLRDLEFSPEDTRLLSGFGFLSLKPQLVLFNLAEGQPQPAFTTPHKHTFSASLQGRLEMDMAQLSADEAEPFKEMYGITELGLEKVIHLSYDLLGYQSFFTVGKDEVRAWRTRRGATAQEAAGVIHTDLQRGFIRAEVIGYHELLAAGGMNEAKAKGSLRLEGKEYPIQDGEIMHVRSGV